MNKFQIYFLSALTSSACSIFIFTALKITIALNKDIEFFYILMGLIVILTNANKSMSRHILDIMV